MVQKTQELREIINIDTSIYNTSFFDKTIQNRMLTNNLASIDSYFDFLSKNSKEIESLKTTLNNNYSEFFRNKLTFDYLEEIILPQLIQNKTNFKRKEIRIWSAGCAGGYEAYSIAILCEELLKTQSTDIHFRIFATDISESEIEFAKQGIYFESKLNIMTWKRVNENFTQKKGTFTISNALKAKIDFSTLDLLDEQRDSPMNSIFGGFDIIFCSNLLFYYNSKSQQQILSKVNRNLLPGGYLIVGKAEMNIVSKECNFNWIPNTSISTKPKKQD